MLAWYVRDRQIGLDPGNVFREYDKNPSQFPFLGVELNIEYYFAVLYQVYVQHTPKGIDIVCKYPESLQSIVDGLQATISE